MNNYAGFEGNRLGNPSGFESLRSLHLLPRKRQSPPVFARKTIVLRGVADFPGLADLFGARITLLKINPTNASLERGSIRREKRFANREDSYRITDYSQKTRCRVGQDSCVKRSP